jgi:hypothetical protein
MLSLRVPIGDRVSYAPALRRTLGDETGATLGGPPAQKPGSELDRGYCEVDRRPACPRVGARGTCGGGAGSHLRPAAPARPRPNRQPRTPKRRQRAAAVLIGATRPAPDTPCPAPGRRSARLSGAARPSDARRRTARPSRGRRPQRRSVRPPSRPAGVERRQEGRQRGRHGLGLAAVVDPATRARCSAGNITPRPRSGPSGTMQKCRTHQMTRSDWGVGIIFSNLLAMASILMGEPSAPGPRALILLTF